MPPPRKARLRKLFGRNHEADIPIPAPDAALPDSAAPLEAPAGTGRNWRNWRKRAVRITAVFLFLFILLVGWLAITAPLSKSLKPVSPPQITLLAADGTPIARNGAIVEQPVNVATLPPHVVRAFLAIEDRRFYSHWGIDPRGMARATWNNLTRGSTQGGSTITQQLAKFTFLTPERSLTRKAREMLIAFWLEAWLSKDEILERYLSNAYFGDNTYGLRAASLHYFHRQPEKLTEGQAAMLAGLMQAPSRYAPSKHFERASKRMRVVLQAMADAGYMTPAQAKAVPTPRLDVRSRNDLPTGTYFADWALPEARKLGDGGYARETLTTTLDSRLQAIARRVTGRAQVHGAQVALVAMRPNGEVVAMVGGKDYAASPFNRATQSRRQPGSTFKLFTYVAALKQGWKPDDTIANTAIESGTYRPQNAGGRYSPSITLEDAFATSSNVAALRLFNEVGDKAVIDTARDFGVTAALPPRDSSLALGTASMSLLELTAAYAGIASNRYPVMPRAFKAEEAGWFDWLFNGPRSLSANNHAAIQRMLRRVVTDGTGRAARLGVPGYGKTGTSQDNRDALFIGYTKDLVVGVWVGNDDNTPLRGISGGGAPARIWRDFMQQAMGKSAPPARKRADPEGPVQPLDLPGTAEIPLGQSSSIRLENGQAVISTDISGIPIDVHVDRDTIRVNTDALPGGGGSIRTPRIEDIPRPGGTPPPPAEAPAARSGGAGGP